MMDSLCDPRLYFPTRNDCCTPSEHYESTDRAMLRSIGLSAGHRQGSASWTSRCRAEVQLSDERRGNRPAITLKEHSGSVLDVTGRGCRVLQITKYDGGADYGV